jgi:hypothetical protein
MPHPPCLMAGRGAILSLGQAGHRHDDQRDWVAAGGPRSLSCISYLRVQKFLDGDETAGGLSEYFLQPQT